ncbi:MAG: hypothetical protein GY795_02890, partial [Desulfobacterales bacterium]|nr:hypothetical protein [Desulfobacterales bacterium]
SGTFVSQIPALLNRAFAVVEKDLMDRHYRIPFGYHTQTEVISTTFWGHFQHNNNHQTPHPALPENFATMGPSAKISLFLKFLQEAYPGSGSGENEDTDMGQHYGLIHLWQLYEKGLIKEEFISCAWYFASYKVFRYGNALMKNKSLWKEVICKILGWDSHLDQHTNRAIHPQLDIHCYYLRRHGMPLENTQLALLGGVIWDGAGLHDKIICGWPAQTEMDPEDDQTQTERGAMDRNVYLWLDSKENRSWNYTAIPSRGDFP